MLGSSKRRRSTRIARACAERRVRRDRINRRRFLQAALLRQRAHRERYPDARPFTVCWQMGRCDVRTFLIFEALDAENARIDARIDAMLKRPPKFLYTREADHG